jgi:PBP1b-binding outer membrane lipoprotein LpoB
MTKRPSVVGVLALVMLAACSKPAPAPSAEDQEKDVAAAVAPQPETPGPSMGPADYPTKLLPMIDTAPQCEPFRAELEEAARVQSSDPLPVDMNKVNEIVARAHAAGCGRKP